MAGQSKSTVAALLLTVVFSLPAAAQNPVVIQPTDDEGDSITALFEQLQQPTVDSQTVESQIVDLWSRSGSPSMDLLLQRGNEAMLAQDFQTAIGFFSALVDHAPDFAQGYSARASAYYNAGMPGPALADIQSALALEPRHFEALTGLAVILEEVSGPKEALEVWQMVARLTPHDPAVTESIDRLMQATGGKTL